MKYHLTGDESWMRCRAEKRPGQNVTMCQLGTDAKSHVFGRAGIAAQGGGVESRWEDGARIDIRISALSEDGTFTATSKKGFQRVYKDTGALMTLRSRSRKGNKPSLHDDKPWLKYNVSEAAWKDAMITDDEKAQHLAAQAEIKAQALAQLAQHPLGAKANEAWKTTTLENLSSMKRADKITALTNAADALLALNEYQEARDHMPLEKALGGLWKLSEEIKLPKTVQTIFEDKYRTALNGRGAQGLPSLLGNKADAISAPANVSHTPGFELVDGKLTYTLKEGDDGYQMRFDTGDVYSDWGGNNNSEIIKSQQAHKAKAQFYATPVGQRLLAMTADERFDVMDEFNKAEAGKEAPTTDPAMLEKFGTQFAFNLQGGVKPNVAKKMAAKYDATLISAILTQGRGTNLQAVFTDAVKLRAETDPVIAEIVKAYEND